ncbi:MAG: hemerythrin domain-containing protein [Vicingus serpentipes]|nr:hemerythrin domain-containing protein [Vicingus serpentipes]
MKAIKRHEALKPLSREHHEGLLLSWKIRMGLKKEVAIDRIKRYCDFFFKEDLVHHFNIEELHVFSLLEPEDELVKRALADHRKLKRLFMQKQPDMKTIVAIEEELEKHIRFEERVLFNKIQEEASEKQLLKVLELHNSNKGCNMDNWNDKFWE